MESWLRFQGLCEALESKRVKLVVPTSPIAPYSVEGGELMNLWYDQNEESYDALVEKEGVNETLETILKIVAELEHEGIPSARIAVGGFSMGASVSLLCIETLSRKVGAIFAFSGFLPSVYDIETQGAVVVGFPVYISYGCRDEQVLPECPEKTARRLKLLGYDVTDKLVAVTYA